jgi:AcrR family transcriptional regulator
MASQSDVTLHRLVDAGRAVFRTVGYHDASVDDVVKAAGVSRSTFYVHFAEKADLLRAVVVDSLEPTEAAVSPPAYAPGAAGLAATHTWIEDVAAVAAEYGAVWQSWTSEMRTDATLKLLGEGRLRRNRATFTAAVARSPAATRSRPESAALILGAFVERVFAFVTLGDDEEQRARGLDTVSRFAFAGFFGGDPDAPAA